MTWNGTAKLPPLIPLQSFDMSNLLFVLSFFLLLLSFHERDYRAIEALDNYEEAGIDDEEQEELDPEARRAIDRELRARDKRTRRGFGRRLIAGLDAAGLLPVSRANDASASC
jgi:hypothetical protein